LTGKKLPLNLKTDKEKKMAIRPSLTQCSVESPAVLYFSSNSYPSSRGELAITMAATDARISIIPPAAGELINPLITPLSFFLFARMGCAYNLLSESLDLAVLPAENVDLSVKTPGG
jgi:hypothetical protein